MKQFTSSIWTLNEDNGLIMAGEERIAQVFGATKYNHEPNYLEVMSNARLIANAPKLYKFIVQLLNDCDLEPDFEGDIMMLLKDIHGGEW